MKLYYSETSPYARKVRLVILEKGLQDKIELEIIDPFKEDPNLTRVNPLGKVPVLIINNKNAIFDSPVICQYLDRFESETKLITPKLKWNILRWQALADGMTDAAYLTVIERRRPHEEQSTDSINAWARDINRCLETMEVEFKQLGDDIHLGHLSFAAALGYIEFRLPHLLPNGTDLGEWYQEFKQRPSMEETKAVL